MSSNSGVQYNLPAAPKGCFWQTNDHSGEPRVTVSLYRDFLSLGSTLVKSSTQELESTDETCQQKLRERKQRCATTLADDILASQ